MDVDSRMATESGSDACDGSGSGSETPTVSPSPSAFRSSSWFYLRVGCDQSHEQVDPEALDRSFLMRVMAARSPNVRLQKAIDRKNQRFIVRILILTQLDAEMLALCAAEASESSTARVECPSERKKALTTPQSKVVRPRQELFHNVKHQTESLAAAARKGTVVKSLFMSTTPKKEPVQTPVADKSKGAVSEVCSKLRKLNLACREVPSRYISQPQPKNTKTAKKSEETTVAKSEKRGLESKTNAKKKILGRSVKRANAGPDGENRNGCSTAADENSLAETAGSHQERKVVLQELRIEVDASRRGNLDDNKENVSSALSEEALDNSSHYGSENILLENNENVPLKENVALKVAKLQKKVHQEQAGKLKKTTNPRVLWDGGQYDPALWASKVGNSWRTTDDITDTWKSMTDIADKNNKWASYAGPGGWNVLCGAVQYTVTLLLNLCFSVDPDMLEVGNGGMTLAEYRSHFSIWALMKRVDQRVLKNKNCSSLKMMIDPLGVQGRKNLGQGKYGCCEVWAGPLSGNRLVVALWNRCSDTANVTMKLPAVGLDGYAAYYVRDLWKHETLSENVVGTFGAQVDVHDTKMYIFSPATIVASV
ncbi:hypothetical protein ZEAMMB73_Zm00001d017715 [Zea mays]|uniref:alpha-galactosidase n=1 Tax=Zea mays TaxID=4577 RepID=A0A1D6HGS6_MAIZE|nr:hypothetical protein ZEAMMB73_Zm00001d017715 [Zea mays]